MFVINIIKSVGRNKFISYLVLIPPNTFYSLAKTIENLRGYWSPTKARRMARYQ